MKTYLSPNKLFMLLIAGLLFVPVLSFSQTAEWRLVLKSYSSTDPDGPGTSNPATGSVQFDLEMHAVSGTIAMKEISLGYTYQSVTAMVPTTPGCTTVSSPPNITVSPGFTAGGYSYSTVNQCNVLTTNTGGRTFDRTASGSLEQGSGTGVTLTTTWVPALSITLWTLGTTSPQGGYVLIHSSGAGSPGGLGSYSIADANGNEVNVNSQSYTTPVAIGSGIVPITLSRFNAACSGTGSLLSWETLTEINNDHFEIEKSSDGITGWKVISTVKGAGNSTTAKQYQFTDLTAGGTSYYRLKQVDTDGKFTYSSVAKTDCQNKAAQLVVYPVPAKDILNVVLSAERNSTATIKLLDITGRLYRLQKTDILKGSNKIVLNVANLLAGQYILRIEKDNEVQTKEVMIK